MLKLLNKTWKQISGDVTNANSKPTVSLANQKQTNLSIISTIIMAFLYFFKLPCYFSLIFSCLDCHPIFSHFLNLHCFLLNYGFQFKSLKH